jgi:hypothetical protein
MPAFDNKLPTTREEAQDVMNTWADALRKHNGDYAAEAPFDIAAVIAAAAILLEKR